MGSPKDGLKSAQAGIHVPEKDFSSKKKEAKADKGSPKGSAVTAKNLPMPTANATPVPPTTAKTWEGSSEDWDKDYSAAKRKGISTSAYEDTPHDRIADAAGERRMKAEGSEEVKHAPEYRRGVSAFANKPKASHGFGHPASACDGHLRNSGSSCAHRIGKKK